MKLPACFVLSLLALMTIPPGMAAEDSLDKDLEALRKKIAAKEAERAQPSQGESPLANQIKYLQALIARGDFRSADEMLEGNLRMYGLPADLQEEWSALVELLRKEVDKKQAAAAEAWRKDIDQLVADTKAGCLAAKSSSDLDALLVRCSSLQMREGRQNTVLTERANRKLQGAAATLESWADFLDFRDAGNTKRANEILRSLRTRDAQFPVLSVQEIDGNFLQNDSDALTIRDALPAIFNAVASPDDLPAAIERVNKLSKSPMNPELNSLSSEKQRLEVALQAWEAAKKGDDTAALRNLDRLSSMGGFSDANSYYEPLKNRILGTILQRKAQTWSKLTQDGNEDANSFLGRILDELQTAGDYAKMIEVMKFSDQLNRQNSSNQFSADRTAIERFLAAQRFESVGDDFGAMTNYRLVIGSLGGKYSPITQAQEAFKKLQAKNPEAYKGGEAAILEEIRSLKMMIQSMAGRMAPGGRPYPQMPGQ